MITSDLRLPSCPANYEVVATWAMKRYGNPNPYESTPGCLIWTNGEFQGSICDSLRKENVVILSARVKGEPYVSCEIFGRGWTLADTDKIAEELDKFWAYMDEHFKMDDRQ